MSTPVEGEVSNDEELINKEVDPVGPASQEKNVVGKINQYDIPDNLINKDLEENNWEDKKVRFLQHQINDLVKVGNKELTTALPNASKMINPKVVGEALAETNNPVEVIDEIEKIDKKAAKNPLVFAEKYLGIDEQNPKHQKTIKGFFDRVIPNWIKNPSEVTKDSRAWCAAFVNNVLHEGKFEKLDKDGDSFNLVRARQYSRIGESVNSIDEAKPGDVIVVKNKDKNEYHVAFYSGKNEDNHLMLGGNQDGRYVNIKEIDRDSLSIVSVRRLKNIEDMSEEDLKKIISSEHYSSKKKKSNLR